MFSIAVLPISASAASFYSAFGGKILNVRYCTCPPFGILIDVGPPAPGEFIYQPGISMLYEWYNIFESGPWVLGIALGSATCNAYVGTTCSPIGFGSIIRKVGTSQSGF